MLCSDKIIRWKGKGIYNKAKIKICIIIRIIEFGLCCADKNKKRDRYTDTHSNRGRKNLEKNRITNNRIWKLAFFVVKSIFFFCILRQWVNITHLFFHCCNDPNDCLSFYLYSKLCFATKANFLFTFTIISSHK